MHGSSSPLDRKFSGDDQRPILFIDDMCNVCSMMAVKMYNSMTNGGVRFASIHSKLGQEAMERYGDGSDRDDGGPLGKLFGMHHKEEMLLVSADGTAKKGADALNAMSSMMAPESPQKTFLNMVDDRSYRALSSMRKSLGERSESVASEFRSEDWVGESAEGERFEKDSETMSFLPSSSLSTHMNREVDWKTTGNSENHDETKRNTAESESHPTLSAKRRKMIEDMVDDLG